MNLYKQFQTDKKLENEGVFIEYGPNSKDEPIRFRVARMGPSNLRYSKMMEQRLKPYRRQIQTETIDSKLADKMMLEIFVDTILLSWEGVESEDGVKLEFNRETAIKLFTDLPDLYDDLREQAGKAALFRAEINRVDAGN